MSLAVPRRYTQVTREIWAMQLRLPKRTRKRVGKLIEHPRFRAAYDFLELRAESGEPVQELYEWWTEYQNADDTEREVLLNKVKNQSESKKRGRRRKRPQS